VKIEHYSFGNITIKGKIYDFDVIVFPETVDPSWWRKEGHSLHMDDLRSVLHASPEVIVIGTGYFGRMDVPAHVLDSLRASGIEVHIRNTRDAVDLFNEISPRRKTVACLHLTC
jgi:hypothetical protein